MSCLRLTSGICALVLAAGLSAAATPKEIEAAVQKGTAVLKQQYKGAAPGEVWRGGQGLGAAALAGLALLESGTPIDDPAIKAITAGVREGSITETGTYHIALALLYLDRLGDPADVPLIQMLGVRLLAGQNSAGGWTYGCVDALSGAEEARLRAALLTGELKTGGNIVITPAGGNAGAKPKPEANPGKPGPAVAGKLDAEVEKYMARLVSVGRREHGDDNSNTQFGVLGVWAARKHGVPVEGALERIERRFLATQTPNGGWPYSGFAQGSPSMTCAGLLGLATAVGRREERRLSAEHAKKSDPFEKPAAKETQSKEPAKPAPKSDDPFFNPAPPPRSDDPFFNPPKVVVIEPKAKHEPDLKKGAPAKPTDARDAAVQRALASLGAVLAGNPQGKGRGRGPQLLAGGDLGDRDFYFLWSVERVGVIYGLEKIGGVDWYERGADELVRTQHGNGSWGRGGKDSDVDTAFALLFLARSNLVRDLTSKVQHDAMSTELRAGGVASPGIAIPGLSDAVKPPAAAEPAPSVTAKPLPAPTPATPTPTVEDPKAVVAELIAATGADWKATLARVRDAKGGTYTQALAAAMAKLDADRLKEAREALAERLTRMTGETLRGLAKAEEAELRRAAVLAMAMKDDRAHLPDLVTALLDDEELVVRAAKASLKSLTAQDFGPAPGAKLAERTAAAKAWLDWIAKQK